MSRITSFFAEFKGWAHWFAGAALSAALIYSSNSAVHDAVNNALASNKKVASFVASAAAILLAYANSKKTQK